MVKLDFGKIEELKKKSQEKKSPTPQEEPISKAVKDVSKSETAFSHTAIKEEPQPSEEKSLSSTNRGLLYAGTDIKQTTPRISKAISQSIARRGDPFLFDNLPDSVVKSWEEAGYIASCENLVEANNLRFKTINGKDIALTSSMMRLIEVLSYFITRQLKEPDIEKYNRNVIKAYERGDNNVNLSSSTGITRAFKTEELALFIYERADETSLRAVQKDLIALSEARAQCLRFDVKDPNKKGKSFSGFSTEPYITIGKQVFLGLEELKEGKRGRKSNSTKEKILVSCEVTFHHIFFINLEKGYCRVNESLFPIWREYGQSELFGIVLNLLQSNFGRMIKNYKLTFSTQKNKEENRGLSSEELGKLVAKMQEKALVYSETLETLDSRLSKPFGVKNRNLLKKKLLEKVIPGLQKYKIILEGGIDSTKKQVYFKLNPDFSKIPDEEEKLLTLQEPEEGSFEEL